MGPSKACMSAYLIAVLCLVAGARNAAAFNYADALDKAVLFFEAQRSGKLPPGQRVAWRADSALSDGNASNVDLVGGYYDAGDNVKFGLPMAFMVTMLSWSVVEFGGAMPGGQLANAEAAVRWGSDYLLKAATATPGALYVQVADPYQDHRCWERPEDMDTPRAVYKVTPQSPGSDVAGETAAALAAASLVFRAREPAYSSRLLRAARQVFDFADRYRGSYSDSLSSVVCPFYCSYSGYQDELLWAATWLHLASSPSPSSQGVYMSYINSNGHTLGAEQDSYTVSWDDKRAATKVLLSKTSSRRQQGRQLPGLRGYKAHADKYICSLVPGAGGFQSQYTPGGLLFKEGDSNMEYVTSTAFLLLTYAKYLGSTGGAASCGATAVTPSTLVSLAKKQVDYILGANPAGMSYMVGFGARYPRRVHHRGASMPSVRDHPARIGCDEGFHYLHSSDPDRNVLVGAVVGGPDQSDSYSDSRDNYAQAEPSTYTNAPLVGALAFFSGARSA
ncbi:endoglucanase 4-like isoform X2 [Triticum dicoccoides]|uniref:endoglucanase 4-like isoform X2 n=1 Tax=Triticum dicoccoides TaxID=85692 RepID=UPI00188F8448|nr:endoglucanase 4-like isoform X2 [Triticum dicoccoides]